MRRILTVISLAIAMFALIAPSALATRAEERQGAALMRDFRAGKQSCASLTTKQFELMGEYLMSRIIGSPAAHDAMNARMKQMMGPAGEAQAHIFLAQRNTGCTNGARPPAGFGQMMGLVGSYRGSGGMGSGMMGGKGANNNGHHNVGSGMIGDHHDGGWGSGMVVLVVLLGGALVAALTVGLMKLSGRP